MEQRRHLVSREARQELLLQIKAPTPHQPDLRLTLSEARPCVTAVAGRQQAALLSCRLLQASAVLQTFTKPAWELQVGTLYRRRNDAHLLHPTGGAGRPPGCRQPPTVRRPTQPGACAGQCCRLQLWVMTDDRVQLLLHRTLPMQAPGCDAAQPSSLVVCLAQTVEPSAVKGVAVLPQPAPAHPASAQCCQTPITPTELAAAAQSGV